ncbi:MAG: DNA-binding protein [Fibrobacter sp.]|nr:DNA-binding protein [Fibrobacter sp.]
MSKITKLFALCLFAGFITTISAQMNMKFKGSDGWGIQGRYEQMYNNFNLEIFSGQITKIDTITPIRDMSYGVQLIVKKDGTDVAVHLGPAWYILHQDMAFQIKDKVEVKACNSTVDGKNVYMAVYVKNLSDRSNKILLLRDRDGIPAWCGYRKE